MDQLNKSQLHVSDALEEKLKFLEETSKAMLNILEDFSLEKLRFEETQRASFNILEDFSLEKLRFEETQRASFNILEDFNDEKLRLEYMQSATLNILDDFNEEKSKLEETQKATLNILEDFDTEKIKVATANLTLSNEISERRQAEERVKKLNKQLEMDAVQLEATNKELEAFSYSVSHDLRAPLRHIDGFIELLKKKIIETADDSVKHYLDIISQASKKLGSLIDELLAYSRTGRTKLIPKGVDLNELVKEVLMELEPQIENRKITWQIDPLPRIQADYNLIKLVYQNLLINSIKFTREKEEAVIQLTASEENEKYILRVKDNGAGFDMAYSKRLFGVFQRLHREDEFEGTGIGLANARRIVHMHSGDIWAEGKVNEGAEFTFSIPKAIGIRQEYDKEL